MINVNCLNNIAACGLKLFSDEYNTESSFEDAQAVLVRSAKMHDMELSDNLLAIARADRKSTRLNSSHYQQSRMPSSA